MAKIEDVGRFGGEYLAGNVYEPVSPGKDYAYWPAGICLLAC